MFDYNYNFMLEQRPLKQWPTEPFLKSTNSFYEEFFQANVLYCLWSRP